MSYQHDAMMRDESMARSLHYQAACIWPHEAPYFERFEQQNLQSVLDLGCGTGLITERLARQIGFNNVVGVDIIEQRIREAKQTWPDQANLRFECVESDVLPFDDGSFDLVVNRHVLQVVPEPKRMIADMARVCRSGGILYFLAEDYGMLHQTELDHDEFWIKSAKNARQHHTDLCIGRRLPQILHQMGFEQIEVNYISIDTLNSDRQNLIGLFEAWRDGYTHFLANINQVPVARAAAHFNAFIDICRAPNRYLVWHIPVIQVRIQ